MLLEFTVANFMSFKDAMTLNMLASTIKEHKNTNVFDVAFPQAARTKNISLLKSSVIYGANASGKSNLIRAISFMKSFVLKSSKSMQISDEIPVRKFLLSTKSDNEPSFFEIIFIHQGVRYRYGFEINQVAVENEWLFYAPKGKEAKLFIREGKKIDISNNFKEGRGLQGKTRKNALFLSVAAQFNGTISTKILNWFGKTLRIISGIDDEKYAKFTFRKMDDDLGKKDILKFISIADLGIKGIEFETLGIEDDEIPDKIKKEIQKIKSKNEDIDRKKKVELGEVLKLVSLL